VTGKLASVLAFWHNLGVHESQADRIEQRLERIERQLDNLMALGITTLKQELRMSKNLDDLTTQVAANTDAEQSAVVLLNQLHQLLVDAGTDPAKLDALKSQLSSSKEALAAAIVANTPSAPTDGGSGGSVISRG
jgi:predicted  nucleic acid-binding Zn-ribbon protein